MHTITKTLMLGVGLFYLASGPVARAGGQGALEALSLGILISACCTLSAHAIARFGARHSGRVEIWAAAIGPMVRIGTVIAGLLVIWWLTSVSMVQLVVVVGVTYPMFLIPSAFWLTAEMNQQCEARIA